MSYTIHKSVSTSISRTATHSQVCVSIDPSNRHCSFRAILFASMWAWPEAIAPCPLGSERLYLWLFSNDPDDPY